MSKSARQQFVDWLRQQGAFLRRLVVLTGAGMSADSGIPTFRGNDALWQAQDDPSRLFTTEALERDPVAVWQMYDTLRTRIAAASPHAGHYALAALGHRRSLVLITQNIDGLHQRAGSDQVVELHGNVWRLRCPRCGAMNEDSRAPLPAVPPYCARCTVVLRPDIVLFGEMLPEDALHSAWGAAAGCDLMLVVGTSGVVNPAAALPEIAQQHGALTVEINPRDTALSTQMHYLVRASAAEALPWVVEVLVDTWG